MKQTYSYMPDRELVDYIQEQTRQGVTAQVLRVSLMEAGWRESDITNALHDVAAGLHPATPGASIHEDLAQVRAVVASLATRVHSIEASLASVGALGAQEQLPSGTMDVAHELPAPKRSVWFGRTVALLLMMGMFGLIGVYGAGLVAHEVSDPANQLIGAAVVGALLLGAAIVTMCRHHLWTSVLLTAAAVTLWSMDMLVAWRSYQFMGWVVATALGVLLFVISFVMGRWITRLAR